MRASRRGFFGFMAAAPVAGKAMAKQVVDEHAANMAGVAMKGYGHGQFIHAPVCPEHSQDNSAFKAALRIPAVREQLTPVFYERNRHVSFIDPDLASKRSFSLAAKIVYQRQRNVERDMAEWRAESTWDKIERLVQNSGAAILGLVGRNSGRG